jgi:hypothetical protein
MMKSSRPSHALRTADAVATPRCRDLRVGSGANEDAEERARVRGVRHGGSHPLPKFELDILPAEGSASRWARWLRGDPAKPMQAWRAIQSETLCRAFDTLRPCVIRRRDRPRPVPRRARSR